MGLEVRRASKISLSKEYTFNPLAALSMVQVSGRFLNSWVLEALSGAAKNRLASLEASSLPHVRYEGT